jgi:hypothetical protein
MSRCNIGPKDCIVIFMVLLDEFDHFGQTFGDLNVSIDSLTLDSNFEGCRDTSFGDRSPRSVFNIICPETMHSCQGAVWKCKVLLIIIHDHNHFLVTKMFAKKKSAVKRDFLEIGWRVFRNFDSFFVDEIVLFFSNFEELYGVWCSVSWPQTVTTLSRRFWY